MEKPYKLLIIDDNEEILNTLNKFFTKKKYFVVTASDGLEGLKILETKKEKFDLVITDIVMPRVSGFGIIMILKKKFPDIPVIAITGFGEHPESLAEEARANIVLEKPINFIELDKMVVDLLSKKNTASEK